MPGNGCWSPTFSTQNLPPTRRVNYVLLALCDMSIVTLVILVFRVQDVIFFEIAIMVVTFPMAVIIYFLACCLCGMWFLGWGCWVVLILALPVWWEPLTRLVRLLRESLPACVLVNLGENASSSASSFWIPPKLCSWVKVVRSSWHSFCRLSGHLWLDWEGFYHDPSHLTSRSGSRLSHASALLFQYCGSRRCSADSHLHC